MRLVLAAASLLIACSRPAPSDRASVDSAPPAAAPSPATAPPPWVLAPDHFGPVRIGSSVADLNAILGDSLKPTYRANPECDYLFPEAFPKKTAAMIVHDTLVRIDVDTTGIRTPEGAGVGDTEASVLALYGARATVTPHKYTGPVGHYVTVPMAGDSTRLTIFETDGKVVVRYRAGIAPPVQYVEGCS